MFLRVLSAAAVAACLCAPSAAQDPKDAAHCAQGRADCEATVAGDDESDLLQVKVRANTTSAAPKADPGFLPSHGQVFAALSKLTYCSAARGTARSAERICGEKGPCKAAGVKIKEGSVRTLSLTDDGWPNAVVAVIGELVSVPGSETPLEPGCVATVRGAVPDTNNYERGDDITMVRPAWFNGTCEDCLVHQGFQIVWMVLMPELISTLEAMSCSKTAPLYLAGHSMGGAVATIGMLAMKLAGWEVSRSWVFNSDRVGNAAYVDYFNTVLTGSEDGAGVTRHTYGKDRLSTWSWHTQANNDTTFAYTWPEVHYQRMNSTGGGNEKGQECFYATTSCGILSEEPLCGMQECVDHLLSPLAPANNIAVFADPLATCILGLGEAFEKEEDLFPDDNGTNGTNGSRIRNRTGWDELMWMADKLRGPLQREGLDYGNPAD